MLVYQSRKLLANVKRKGISAARRDLKGQTFAVWR